MGDQQPSIDKIKLVLSTELIPEADVLEIMNLVNAKLSKVRMRSISRTPKQADISDLLQSLLTGEKEYVSNLNKMVKGYLMPIRTGIIKVKMQTMLGIFSNVDILLNVHTELLRDIESIVAGNNTLQSVFLRAVPSMKIYTQFVNNFSNAMDTLEEEKKKNKFFCAYIQQQDENNHMELETLLSMPLNRISQYQRTVNHVTKLTPESSEEYKQLADCLKELEMLQEYVNQSLIQSDNMSHIINVEKKVIGRESIALRDINRIFKREGAITQVESDKKIKDQYYFLFNDVLMITKVIGKGSYKYKSLLPLQYGSLKDEDGLKFTIIGKDGVAQHFIANSPKEKEEWIKDFREVFDAMEKTKVFDTDLAVLMAREPPDALIPSFIEELLKYIEERALETAGIFRISASKMHVLSLIDQINRGISIDVPFLEDHVVANLLKQFLRNLPEPIIPFAFYDEFCAVYNSDDQVGCLKTLVQKLPDANRNLLKRLFQVLSKIAAKNEINMMTPSNLAIVIGPNLSRRRQESLAMDDFAATGASEVLVKDYETIFETQLPRSPRASASLSSQFAKAFIGTSPRPAGNASRPVLGKRAPASMIGNRTNRGTDSPPSPLQSSASSSSLSSSSSSSLSCSLPAIPTSDDEPEQSKPTESPPHEDLKADPEPSPPSSSSPSPVSSSPNSPLSSVPTVTVPLRNAVKLPPPPSKARPTMEAQRKSLRAPPISLQGAGSRKSVSTLPNPNKLSDDALKLELPPPPETLVADRLRAIGEDPSTLPPLTSSSSAPAIKKGPAPPGKRPITVKTACGACQKPIAGTGLKALNKSWHTECFVCTHCKKPFQAGEFVEYEGLPYCPDDYGSLFTDEEETCGRCNKPISDEMIEALDRSWHPECFACSVCAGDLSNGYFSKAGQPVCPNCKKL